MKPHAVGETLFMLPDFVRTEMLGDRRWKLLGAWKRHCSVIADYFFSRCEVAPFVLYVDLVLCAIYVFRVLSAFCVRPIFWGRIFGPKGRKGIK